MAVEKIATLVADPPSPGPAARDAARSFTLIAVVDGPDVPVLFNALKGLPGMSEVTCAGCGIKGVVRSTIGEAHTVQICPKCQEKGRAGGTV